MDIAQQVGFVDEMPFWEGTLAGDTQEEATVPVSFCEVVDFDGPVMWFGPESAEYGKCSLLRGRK